MSVAVAEPVTRPTTQETRPAGRHGPPAGSALALEGGGPGALGVDLDTRQVSVVALDCTGEIYRTRVIAEEGRTADLRFDGLVAGFEELLREPEMRTVHVWLEGTPFVKNRKGFASLAQVLGALRAACVGAGLEHTVLDGPDWKRALGLSGNANKDQITEWVLQQLPQADKWLSTQDLRDAYAIARAGQALGG